MKKLKRLMKKYFRICVIFLLFASFQAISQQIQTEESLIQVGEELIYDVSFLTVQLGTIKIVTLPDTSYQGRKVAHSKVFIQSNPGIPFYSLKAVFNSLMDTTLTEGKYFDANTKENSDDWGFQKIIFTQKSGSQTENGSIVRVEKWYNKEKINDTTICSKEKVIDGSTLFFLSRKLIDRKMNLRIPTIMDLSIGDTKFYFTGKIEKIKIAAVDYPVKVYYFDGKAEWVALYGLGDKFQGWFSCDAARVPIYAKMNVYLGSINIELRSWKRRGWFPPKF